MEGPHFTQGFLRFTSADPDAVTLSIPLGGATADPPDVVAGLRYENSPDSNQVPHIKLVPTSVNLSSTGPVSPKKGRRKIWFPTHGFCVYL